jgi:hypothetical protein
MSSRPPTSGALEAIAAPLYAFAALLVAIPALDFVQSVGMPQLGNLQWRFATVGLLSSVLLTPLLGVVIAMSVASLRGHVVAMRLLALASAIAAGALVVLVAGFLLDVFQLRSGVPEAGRAGFRTASMKAVTKHLAVALILGFLAARAWRVSAWRAPAPERAPVPIVSR